MEEEAWRRGPTVPSSLPTVAVQTEGPLLHAKFHPHRCNYNGVGPPKLKFLLIFHRNVEYKTPRRCVSLARFSKNLHSCTLLPAALHAAQGCRYLIYSEADFEVFRPAGATHCTDGGEIWHGGGDLRSPPLYLASQYRPKVPSSMPNVTPIGATITV